MYPSQAPQDPSRDPRMGPPAQNDPQHQWQTPHWAPHQAPGITIALAPLPHPLPILAEHASCHASQEFFQISQMTELICNIYACRDQKCSPCAFLTQPLLGPCAILMQLLRSSCHELRDGQLLRLMPRMHQRQDNIISHSLS